MASQNFVTRPGSQFFQSGTGAIERTVESKLQDVVSVKDFGAVGDGVTNDTAAIQAAIDAVYTAGGGSVSFTGRHLVDSSLTVKDYVTLVGPLGLADELLPGTAADYDAQKGVLIVNSAATINVLDGASISNCLLIRKGLNLPFANATAATSGVAAFAGTAITVAGAGAYLHHLMILGFNKAIYSTNQERVRCEYINGDCTNGIEVLVCYDISYIENCHFWPFTTAHQSWTTNVLLTRSGTAYRYANVGDWCKFTNCFSYGYARGFSVESADHVQLIGCGTDYVSALASTSKGYEVSGTAVNTTFVACQAAAQYVGIYVDTLDSQNAVKIIGCDFWANDLYAIQVNRGYAAISGCSISQSGVRCEDAARVLISGNQFVSADNSIGPLALPKSTITRNTYTGSPVDSTLGERLSYDNISATNSITIANNTALGQQQVYSLSRGTISSPTISSANDAPINLSARVFDGSTFGDLGGLRFQAQGAPSSGNTRGLFVLSTTPASSLTRVDRVALYGDGNFAPLADNAQSLGISGGRWSAVWAANGTIQTSDERTKTDIAPSTLGLDFVNALNPVSYKFKEGGNEVVRQVYRDQDGNECSSDAPGAIASEIITTAKPGERTHWGLIAQEVKAAVDAANVDFGGWLLTDKDDPDSQQALRYDQFIAPLIKAVQELSAEVRILKDTARLRE